MINDGFSITVDEEKEMKNFKKTSAYGSYLKSIASSPTFSVLMNEHINDIDITDDIQKLVINGKNPDTQTAKALNDVFKRSISRMAIGIVADTFILKELEEIKIEEVIGGLKEDSAVTYLLGLADKKYYDQAAKLVKEGKLEENSIAVRGLLAYMKNAGVAKNEEKELLLRANKKTTMPQVPQINTKKDTMKVDFDSNHIEL
jgi:hypothetical protein